MPRRGATRAFVYDLRLAASYFEVLQLRPAMGRFFTVAEDTTRDRDAVAVISHAF